MLDDREFQSLVDDVIFRSWRRLEKWYRDNRTRRSGGSGGPCLEGILRQVDWAVRERRLSGFTSSREDAEFYGLLARAATSAEHDPDSNLTERMLDDLELIRNEAGERERLAFIASLTVWRPAWARAS